MYNIYIYHSLGYIYYNISKNIEQENSYIIVLNISVTQVFLFLII